MSERFVPRPPTLADRIDQRLFDAIYSRSLVYNSCWEDPAVDRQALDLRRDDILLAITSAGCNVLDYALAGPARIHAVDANPRQSALLERKLAGDMRVLWQLLCGPSSRGPHAERLQRFYAPQAALYDRFRERLLHGRQELIELLPTPPAGCVIELGGGTGRNIEFFGPRLDRLARFELVDLCPALLEVARKRAGARANVRIVEADAATYQPDGRADCVYFAYSLTMIPDWSRAIDNAVALLKPGGMLGAVDFYVSPAVPAPRLARHGVVTRTLWPLWFRHDGVRLSHDHLPCLRSRLETVQLSERRAPLPYLPGCSVPYYIFLGRKRNAEPSARA